MDLGSIAGTVSGLVSGGSLSGMAVFHNTIQILMGTTMQNMKDVTAMFPPLSFMSIHYQDPISFEADTLELTFADIGDQIIKSTQVRKGIWVKVKIDQWNRDYPGSHVQRDLGSFQIDQIKSQWPPTQVTLMATSVPISSQIKLTLNNKTRLAINLQQLGQQVASENGLGYEWDVPASSSANNRPLSTASQWNESDLSMLSRMCRENALSMKIKDINGKQTLVIFDEQQLEKGPPQYTIDFSQPAAGIALIHGELTTQSQDIYSGSQLSWFDPNSNTLYVGRATAPPDSADGSVEQLNSWYTRNLGKDASGQDIATKGDTGF
jgi:hypothetical protein